MSGLNAFVAVAAGGALGASARYGVSLWLAGQSSRFPFATLAANISGAFLAGVIVSLLLARSPAATTSYLLLVTGFLGSFTTLSAFSIETLRLWQSGYTVSALIYVFATVIGAMTAALLGSLIAQAG